MGGIAAAVESSYDQCPGDLSFVEFLFLVVGYVVELNNDTQYFLPIILSSMISEVWLSL